MNQSTENILISTMSVCRAVDENKKGIYFDAQKNSWVCYSYSACTDILKNNKIVSKNRLQIPLSFFNEDEKIKVAAFVKNIGNSLIFTDKIKKPHLKKYVNFHNEKQYNEVADKVLADSNTSVNTANFDIDIAKDITEKYNNQIANRIFSLFSIDLNEEAIEVGKIFDGKIQSKNHFLEIIDCYNKIYNDLYKKVFEVEENKSDVQSIVTDLAVVYIAAHNTTAHLINSALVQCYYSKIAITEENVSKIIQEAGRLLSPVTAIGRVVSEDFEYNGYSFKKRDKITFLTGLANHDPAVYSNPYKFNIDRDCKPLTFGVSPFQCIGMGIATEAAKAMLNKIANRMQLLELKKVKYDSGASAVGINMLQMRASMA